MSNTEEYGKMTKRIVFTENDHRHAQLVLKLKYLRLTQAAFFRHVISGLLEDDPRIVEFANDISFKSKDKRSKSEKLQKIGVQKMRDFGLSEDDVEDIFDLIEEEGPEL
jgi:hypothetical protein